MPASTSGLSTSTIKWATDETEITRDERAYADITAVGYVKFSGATISGALGLVPAIMPIATTGPCGSDSNLLGSQLQTASAKFEGDGTIRVEGKYRKILVNIVNGPGGDTGEQTSDFDKVGLRINVQEAPILTHPLPQTKFPRKELNLLSGLLNGFIRTNWDIEQESGGSGDNEFVRQNPEDNYKWTQKVTFSETPYSVEIAGKSVTASPLDYARIIKAGVTTWEMPSSILTWDSVRNAGVSSNEMNGVGSVVNPPVAPAVNNRDWLYQGLNQQQVTDDTLTLGREFLLSGPGGALKQIYPGGTGDINANPDT
jgi:hypothetical protein